MMKRHVLKFLSLSMAVTLVLAGCRGSQNKAAEGTKAQTEGASGATEVGSEETGSENDGQMPDVWVKEEVVEKKKDAEVLVVSFGTSYNETREVTIGGIEDAIAGTLREYPVRRAFTSQIIIDKLKERDCLEIDNVEQALDRAVEGGIKTLVVQPSHIMNGYEYTELEETLADYQDKFEKVSLGSPLLTSEEDFDKVVKVLSSEMEEFHDGETAVVFMGHGTESSANSVYAKLQEKLETAGCDYIFIGTVEAEPSLEDVKAMVAAKSGVKKIVLLPFMVVAGDHANNDMAGDGEESWKSQFEAAGYEVECLLVGLGQIPGIRQIYADHAAAAAQALE